MSWFKDKGSTKPAVAPPNHEVRHKHSAPHVSHDVEERLAKFLISHERLQERAGRPLMHLLGVAYNQHDGSTDYSVRSRVHDAQGKDHRFDSTIRVYATGHLRLVR
jgi:hypothetical protein